MHGPCLNPGVEWGCGWAGYRTGYTFYTCCCAVCQMIGLQASVLFVGCFADALLGCCLFCLLVLILEMPGLSLCLHAYKSSWTVMQSKYGHALMQHLPCVTRRKHHRPGIAPNANTTHVSHVCYSITTFSILKYEKLLYSTRILGTLNPGSHSPGCYLCPISHSTVIVLAAARGFRHAYVATSACFVLEYGMVLLGLHCFLRLACVLYCRGVAWPLV